MYVVARLELPTCTVEPETKLVPVTVTVNALLVPTATELGLNAVTFGAGFVTASVKGEDVPPPGVGFTTSKVRFPSVARSATARTALTCVALPKLVERALPLTCRTVAGSKPVPVTLTLVAADPVVTLVGASAVSVGEGLFTVTLTGVPELLLPLLLLATTLAKRPS